MMCLIESSGGNRMAHRRAEGPFITATGLGRLLARLDPDRDRAAQEYERLRHALTRFFDWRGAWPADECADEVLDRLARKLQDEVDVVDVRQYVYGIARLVLLERSRQRQPVSVDAAAEVADLVAVPPDPAADALHACLDRCLDRMAEDSRQLVLAYYQGERRARIANRRKLATALGLSSDALRSRVQRLRDGLEQCVTACVSRK